MTFRRKNSTQSKSKQKRDRINISDMSTLRYSSFFKNQQSKRKTNKSPTNRIPHSSHTNRRRNGFPRTFRKTSDALSCVVREYSPHNRPYVNWQWTNSLARVRRNLSISANVYIARRDCSFVSDVFCWRCQLRGNGGKIVFMGRCSDSCWMFCVFSLVFSGNFMLCKSFFFCFRLFCRFLRVFFLIWLSSSVLWAVYIVCVIWSLCEKCKIFLWNLNRVKEKFDIRINLIIEGSPILIL